MTQRFHASLIPFAAAVAEAEVNAFLGAGWRAVGLPTAPVMSEGLDVDMLEGSDVAAPQAAGHQIITACRRAGWLHFIFLCRFSKTVSKRLQDSCLRRDLLLRFCVEIVLSAAGAYPVGHVARLGTGRFLCRHSGQAVGMRGAGDLGGVIVGLSWVLFIELENASVARHGKPKHAGNCHVGHKAAVVVLQIQIPVVQLKAPRAGLGVERRQRIERVGRGRRSGMLTGQIAAGVEAPN